MATYRAEDEQHGCDVAIVSTASFRVREAWRVILRLLL